MLSRRLRVAVPARVFELSLRTGHGRVWRSVLAELDGRVRLRRDGGRADVWLFDGHAEPPADDGRPAVAFMSEGPPDSGDAAVGVSAEFMELLHATAAATAARADRIVVPSQASARQVAHPAVDVVAHGVDASRFAAPSPAERPPYVLFTGQLHPRKNLAALREAMALLARRGHTRALVVVGGGAADREDASRLEAEALAPIDGVAVERVRTPDDRALAALMAGADAFCLPSLWEGFGLPILEAMAAGAAVVASARGALPEVVGDAGLLVEPEPEALADALERVVTDAALAARLRAAAAERAAQFTWARTADGWLASLRRAAGRRT